MSNSSQTVVEWLWEQRNEVAAMLSGLYNWFRGQSAGAQKANPAKPKPGILIIGPGGVGKTTLGKLLSGQYDFLFDLPGTYDESLEIESYSLKDAPDVEVVVPPGQPYRRDATWADLFADLAAGKFRGIIMLASYGYHNHGLGKMTSYKEHPLYKGNKDNFLMDFLEDRRREELACLRQLAPHVKLNKGKLWFLTVVTKQDLWWSNREDVENHYRKGEYGNEVQKMLDQQGTRQFRHELALTSLVISNFTTGKSERLKPNTAGYDQEYHVQSLRRLFETVVVLQKWEAGT